ncbi:MAG: hypothetical protein M1825_006292 [Sarcosagium campestre]|nr:MAG: hypothetical protein M1825_006292 [Sarcosagium campestre]
MVKSDRSLTYLASLDPPATTRAWLSAPHPHLPLVAVATSSKTTVVYSLVNFKRHSTISGGHKRSIRSVAWKPLPAKTPAAVLATGSFDASIGIWQRDQEAVSSAIAAGGNAGSDGNDDDPDDGWRFSVVLDGHDSEVKSVAWTVSGAMLATCARDKSIWLWEDLGDDEFETVAVLQEHEGDVKCVAWAGERDVLASASYDDTIRLWKEDADSEWVCSTVLKGHEGTVWAVTWEGTSKDDAAERIVSCSSDQTVRVWKRLGHDQAAKEKRVVPSTFRSAGEDEEEWEQQAVLPAIHEREIYGVAWSRETGLIVSTGGDGRVVVYEERAGVHDSGVENTVHQPSNGDNEDSIMDGADDTTQPEGEKATSEWAIIAEIEAAHGVYEINHVCWAQRFDNGKIGGEMILTSGDDGEVKCWTIEAR